MNIPKLNIQVLEKAARHTGHYISRNSPHILTGLGAAGVISTSVLACKATVLAVDILEPEDVDWKVKVKKTWKLYIPAAVSGAATIACIIAANTINTKRKAALAAAYTLSQNAYSAYREEIQEFITPEQDRAALAKATPTAKGEPSKSDQKSLLVGDGTVLCFDSYSGRYFKSTKNKIDSAINQLNMQLMQYDTASLNDFYSLLQLDATQMGDELGWQSGHLVELEYIGIISSDGTPALSMQFKHQPTTDWFKLN